MRLNIKTYLVASNSASNHPVGTIIPMQPCSYKNSGWDSVVQFQKDRMLHHLGHHSEFAVPMKDGVKIIERFGSHGFKRVMEVSIHALTEGEQLRNNTLERFTSQGERPCG